MNNTPRAYKDGTRKFYFHMAEDAIKSWLSDKPHLLGYFKDLEKRGGELAAYQEDPRCDAWMDEAEAAANALTDQVYRATGDTFTGEMYGALVEAARDRLNINW